jgi:hypothetical protein
MTNEQIISRFLNGATTGSNKQGSLFIEGDTLYSYGRHYPLAQRLLGAVWVNSARYSNTTSKQASLVRSAASRKGITLA